MELFGIRCAGVPRGAGLMSYGHTTVKAPHPIRTAKLSTVGPDQYYGRGLRGNLRCCKALFYFLRCVQLLVFVHACDAPGVLAQSEACVLSKHEVLGSKPRYSKCIRYGVVGNISACHADARGSIPRFGVIFFFFFFSLALFGPVDPLILGVGPRTRHFARVVKGLAC